MQIGATMKERGQGWRTQICQNKQKSKGIGTKRSRGKAQQRCRWIFSKYGLGLVGDESVDKDDIN